MRAIAIALFAVGLLVCDLSGQEQTGAVRVEVVTSNGEPVAAVEVVVAGITQRTDELGVAVLTVPVGSVQVTVAQAEFIPVTVSVNVVSAQEQRVIVALVRSGPRNLDSGLSGISIVFQAAVPKPVVPKYTTSGVRRPSEL